MTATAGAIIEPNPFSTRRVRPGAIPYLFPRGDSVEQLVSRLRANDWRGQIIGPHGSGKSTLLATLLPELRRVGVRPVIDELHDWSRRLPTNWRRQLGAELSALFIIDGFELLPRLTRLWTKLHCRMRGCGLLVTAHASVGLPELYRTHVTQDAARTVVDFLLQDSGHTVSGDDLLRRFAAHRGDMRATLFDLYDLVEARRRPTCHRKWWNTHAIT